MVKIDWLKIAVISLLGFCAGTRAANDNDDLSKQQPKYHIKEIPPAPVLSPEEELKTFKLPPGFHMELVAAEPMVERPVAVVFDPDGRMYVVEMRAYMPDMKGTGELEPTARVTLLEDTDGDGKIDKKSIFLDKLVIPRSISLAGDGVLVAEPPDLWFCRDTNGDGVSDDKQLVLNDFGVRLPNANPEHMANGLIWGLDNWYYVADWTTRLRYSKGKFLREGTVTRGQWGISQDDIGRLYYNSNSSMLRVDYVPAQYLTRNPFLGNPVGVNVAVAPNTTHPSRVNPGVNRGYTQVLDMDGKLASVTAACGPVVYRGDKYPKEYYGNVFVCEPSGNLVIRHAMSEEGVKVTGKPMLNGDIDFLTSTDERFRPVNMYTAPDGTLYLLDMYHGIIQHGAYLSAYLKDQIKKRDLETGGIRGRIWRIVHDSAKPGPQPKLAKASTEELVKTLSHPNGWWRDTAQRLLVEKQDKDAVRMLEGVITSGDAFPLSKVHALWVLQGMDKLKDNIAFEATRDADPRVRLAALRAGESLVLKNNGPATLQAAISLANDPDPKVQLQVLFMASPANPALQAAANGVLIRSLNDPIFRAAALNGAMGRELELLQSLLADTNFVKAPAGQKELLNDLAECVVRGRSAERIEKLFDVIAGQPTTAVEFQHALMHGIMDAIMPDPKSKTPPRKLRLLKEPAGLTKLEASTDKKLKDLAIKANAGFTWPNKPGDTTPPLTPLTAAQQKRYDSGKELFSQICAVCHQPSGLGLDGTAPPLVDSEWVLGSEERLVRIVLNGLRGPVKVGKKSMDFEMPNIATLQDEQLSSILTYIRREWGHEANPVEPEHVAKIREACKERGENQWTVEELLKIK